MEDVELVIKIPKEVKNRLCFGVTYAEDIQTVCEALHNGTPLPKGHGVLKDVTNLMRGLYTDTQTTEETFTSSEVYRMIDEECPIIIEADKEESEDKE